MNTKNLILTDTKDMSERQWLDWRSPLWHIKRHIRLNHFPDWTDEQIWGHSHERYVYMAEFFSSDEWKNLQLPCIGASEIAVVMGLNPYTSIIELFYEKCGIKPSWDEENEAMFWGSELEADIAEKWQCWPGNAQEMIENFRKGIIVRKCRRINFYIQNIAFPWLFCSLDRIINKVSSRPEGALECKCISGYAANMWENGIPPMYVMQLQTQLKITEFEFGELAILKDGRYMDVFPFDYSEGIGNNVVQKSEQFYKLVKTACAHFLLYTICPDEATRQLHLSEIDRLAPEPDGSKSYEKYLNATYQDNGGELIGDIVALELAKDHQYWKKEIERLDGLQTLCSNKLKAAIGESNTLDFGDNGKVTWKKNKNNVRSMRFHLKNCDDHIPESVKAVNKDVNN